MTYKEESYLLDTVTQIASEVHENNLMLRDLCAVVNTWLAHHNQENEDDFGRNVAANLISNLLDIGGLSKRSKK